MGSSDANFPSHSLLPWASWSLRLFNVWPVSGQGLDRWSEMSTEIERKHLEISIVVWQSNSMSVESNDNILWLLFFFCSVFFPQFYFSSTLFFIIFWNDICPWEIEKQSVTINSLGNPALNACTTHLEKMIAWVFQGGGTSAILYLHREKR